MRLRKGRVERCGKGKLLGAVAAVEGFIWAKAMTIFSLLGMTVKELVAWRPDLIVHDDPSEIQVSDTSAYVTHPDGEFEIVCNGNGVADTIFVFRETPLLDGIVGFGKPRKEILAQLGVPSASGEEKVVKYLGAQGAWDRFDYSEWSIHFQFMVGSDRLEKLTVMTREIATSLGEAPE
jgi:hypothetical protein